jgi:hypothetical protein
MPGLKAPEVQALYARGEKWLAVNRFEEMFLPVHLEATGSRPLFLMAS